MKKNQQCPVCIVTKSTQSRLEPRLGEPRVSRKTRLSAVRRIYTGTKIEAPRCGSSGKVLSDARSVRGGKKTTGFRCGRNQISHAWRFVVGRALLNSLRRPPTLSTAQSCTYCHESSVSCFFSVISIKGSWPIEGVIRGAKRSVLAVKRRRASLRTIRSSSPDVVILIFTTVRQNGSRLRRR